MEVYEQGKEERIGVVIDEFPYLAKSAPHVVSILQKVIDHSYLKSKIMLILCGSSMSFMVKQILGYESPLYGRRTSQMKIKPFSYMQCKAFFPNLSSDDLMCVYGVSGGIPQYLSFMCEESSLKNNIMNAFLSSKGPLYEEPTNLLLQELREPASYNSILSAIAKGASRLVDISNKANMSSNNVSAALDNLIELGIVEKLTPITQGAGRSKKTIYRICDSMFRFWYRYIIKNQGMIERGRGNLLYIRIENEMNDFLGPVFEQVCIDWMWNNVPNSKYAKDWFEDLGPWWGSDPNRREEVEIDIAGFSPETNAVFLAECKWRNKQVDTSTLQKLLERGTLFSNPIKYYFVFSKSGFTKECIDLAKKVDAFLISFSEM
jgi:AAA+ ATPase superfamily predicted ATPase